MLIGVLAVQGAFIEHIGILDRLGVESREIRNKDDLLGAKFDGLILPGGESTTMGKLLVDLDLFDDIKSMIQNGMAVFGTCAGMILLASSIENDSKTHLGTMNISVIRNAYGRQLGSFNVHENFAGTSIEMPFIRAPYIHAVGDDVEVLSVVNDKIVAAKQGKQLATAFHPELTKDDVVHKYFLDMIKG